MGRASRRCSDPARSTSRHAPGRAPSARRLTGLLALLALSAAPAAAQQQHESIQNQIRDSQLRLEQIRQQRDQLKQEMQQAQSRVQDVSSELENIERQVAVSNKALEELDFQASAVQTSVQNVTTQLKTTRERLAARKALLNKRLRTIYERGPLSTLEVLLSAHSFGELLDRYKYMHLIALHDQALVKDIGRLESKYSGQEQELQQEQDQLEQVRQEKVGEVRNLKALELRRKRALAGYRRQVSQKRGSIAKLERSASQLTDLVGRLESRRRAEARRLAAEGQPAKAGAITTRDLGSLNWPVDGRLVYRFGPERKANGVILRWNGIGIGAPLGTPVKAVEAGTVVLAGPFEGYGPSVMISHGGGYYTLYLYLQNVDVRTGEHVADGQVVGTVGGADSPEGPHIEFQVRAPVNGAPVAVDPLSWLRSRGGGS